MSRVTERTLKDVCLFANQGPLRTWSFGLMVERHGEGFMLYRLHRRAGDGRAPLFTKPLPAREVLCFLRGFLEAACLANGGEGR